MTTNEARKKRRNDGQNTRRLGQRVCGNCARSATEMYPLYPSMSQTIPVCHVCLTLFEAVRCQRLGTDLTKVLEAVQVLADEGVPYETSFEAIDELNLGWAEVCLRIISPSRRLFSEEELYLLEVKESEKLEEYLRGRIG